MFDVMRIFSIHADQYQFSLSLANEIVLVGPRKCIGCMCARLVLILA